MNPLSDPRIAQWTQRLPALLQEAAKAAAGPPAVRAAQESSLASVIASRLAMGDDEEVRNARVTRCEPAVARAFDDALAQAVERMGTDAREPLARVFTLPVVLIAGAGRRSVLPGAIADTAALTAVFERHGAIGRTRNFGLSNALVKLESLESLRPAAIYRATRSMDPTTLHAALPPADILVDSGREHAHLRFLVGAGIVSADAPSFAETGANVGAWGREVSNVLGKMLGQPGVQLLVLPRPPRDLVHAAHAGRDALLEIAWHLFVSNAVRQMRMQAGDPVAILSTHDDCDLRVTLSSPFADDLVEGFRWPLGREDDLPDIQHRIVTLLGEVRLSDVRVLPWVMPAERAGGGPWHPRVGEWEKLAGDRRH